MATTCSPSFARGESEGHFASLPPHRLVQICCSAPEPALRERFRSRARHPGHLDAARVHDVLTAVRTGRHGPPELAGTLLEVDTTQDVAVDEIARAVA